MVPGYVLLDPIKEQYLKLGTEAPSWRRLPDRMVGLPQTDAGDAGKRTDHKTVSADRSRRCLPGREEARW